MLAFIIPTALVVVPAIVGFSLISLGLSLLAMSGVLPLLGACACFVVGSKAILAATAVAIRIFLVR